ncbi:MAG: DUF1573 domain-containing protein [Aliifodinibius sp.]|nr:DUF1573 domain-containing protein [Fodinibius sp.]NIV10591.1 DUF1573 domain-containing protein [Fodinibius sp.]NIY24219.1 DUF1573 domain-containing protein [Fodinibius sp.]
MRIIHNTIWNILPTCRANCLLLLVSSFVLSSCSYHERIGQSDNGFPKIVFQKTSQDFGIVGKGSIKNCEFMFSNEGEGFLTIEDIKAPCMCTVANLTKKIFTPGEKGTIKITYTAPILKTESVEHKVTVYSNDPHNQEIQLTIQANVIDFIQVDPLKPQFEFGSGIENEQPILLRSIDGKPFSILEHKSSKGIFDFEYNPDDFAAEYTLYPLLNKEKWQKVPLKRGRIWLSLSHPECTIIVIPFTVRVTENN